MLNIYHENVKQKKPLIHNITNYVTVNDCANVLLACGASPIMSDDIEEVTEITSICNGLNINIGTLNQQTIPAMFEAGSKANALAHPIVLDPVGAGASKLRTKTAVDLINKVKFAVIRGNISEIKTLAQGTSSTRGVDADISDVVTKDNINQVIMLAKDFAKKTGAVIAITGAVDIVANDKIAYVIYNGHSMMSSVTGTGCQLSSIICAFVAANLDNVLEATVAAVCTMGVAGEIAYQRLSDMDGNATYRNYIIDAINNLDGKMLDKMAKYERYMK